MTHLDGNVLAGVASSLFAFDLPTATGQCDACLDVASLAEAMVYGAPMGFVVRCRNCCGVLALLVERPGDLRLDMRGLRWLTPSAADYHRPAAVAEGTRSP
ncbi:DUF6510 family protein [Curtobacterium sp. MCLR17_007]|jgi:hypothetical protein|uniref:DUF6510 family protein n=1 Tax=unclassified Curtobacterium TaxID=257496 RepID=UPI001C651067|nr:DUF6510 family protein [Curtobacterium sp. MCLR17_007]WIB60990.1 DUF6510 family protein [Curtobacterium sp. MCLR17_007]